MATAPDWTKDEKKRRLYRGRASDFGNLGDIVAGGAALSEGYNPPPPEFPDLDAIAESGRSAGRARSAPAPRAGGLGRQIERALRGTAAYADVPGAVAADAAPEQIPLSDPRNQFSGRVFDGRSDLSDTNLRGAGLQRVVKTGDGAYTDNPNATGDVRYYNQLGRRADVSGARGLTRNTTPAEHLAMENASALDLTDPANARAVLENGREAQRVAKSLAAEAAARQRQAQLDALAPEDFAQLQAAAIKEQGESSRAAATNNLTRRGQDIQLQGQQAALINAQGTQAQRDFENQLKLSERLNDPETRQAEISRVLAPLRGLSRAEAVRRIGNDPAMQAVITALENSSRGTLWGGGKAGIGVLGGLGRNSTFADLSEDNLFPGFGDQNALLGGYVDPTKLSPDLDEDLFRSLIAFRKAQSASNRGR